MQHCVITDVPLGQMRRDPFAPRGFDCTHSFLRIRRVRIQLAREGLFSAIPRSRISQSPLREETA